VGSSNAAKITRALENQGFSCHLVSAPNWRATSAAAEELRHHLKEAIREKDPTTIIYFLLDNSVFYGRHEDGSCSAPKKGSDGG
jgi:signal recognition particle GTPase